MPQSHNHTKTYETSAWNKLLKLCKFEDKSKSKQSFQNSFSAIFFFKILNYDLTIRHQVNICHFSIYLTCMHVIKICSFYSSRSKYSMYSVPSKSVACTTVKIKRVHSDVNMIGKNAVNVVRDSIIASASPAFRHI